MQRNKLCFALNVKYMKHFQKMKNVDWMIGTHPENRDTNAWIGSLKKYKFDI